MPRIPLNLFGASFGIAGLAGAWTTAAGQQHVPAWIGRALFVVAAVSWLLTVIGYAGWAIRNRRRVHADLTDPVAAPFAALAVITPVLLAAGGAFTFSWAAVVSATLHWTSALAAPAQVALTYLLLAAVTLLVGGIGTRTILALGRGHLLPAVEVAILLVYEVLPLRGSLDRAPSSSSTSRGTT